MDLRFVEIPKIENENILEDLAKDILQVNDQYENVNKNGRSGQKQDGVDVYAREINSSNWLGIQCKIRATNRSFTKSELLIEINKAKAFNPRISEYILFTTLSRDSPTQEIERELQIELKVENSFNFKIQYWEDIEEMLRSEQFEEVYYRYYYKYFKDNLVLGHAIGKLVNLELQFDGIPDTHCELIIGKIPRYKNDNGTNVNYYRGTYFIVNLHRNKIEFFNKDERNNKASCFPDDIIDAIENRIDSFRISKWLMEIENIDNFIYDDNHDYKFSISEQERQGYLKNEE